MLSSPFVAQEGSCWTHLSSEYESISFIYRFVLLLPHLNTQAAPPQTRALTLPTH